MACDSRRSKIGCITGANNCVWLHFIRHVFSPSCELKDQTASHDSSLINEAFSLSFTHTNHKSSYLWCRPRYITSAIASVVCNVTLIAVSLEFKEEQQASLYIYIKANLFCSATNHCTFWTILRTRRRSSLMFFLISLITALCGYVNAFLSHRHTLPTALSFRVLTGLCPSQFPPNFLSIFPFCSTTLRLSLSLPSSSLLLLPPPIFSGGPWARRFGGLDNQPCLMVHSPLILQGGQLQKNSTSTPEVCEHTYTVTQAPSFPFSYSQNTAHTHTYTNTANCSTHPLLLFHMHMHTQPIKIQLTRAFKVLALSPLFPPFLFSHLLCVFICTLFLFSPFIRISPFSQASLRALPLLNHYQTAQWLFRGALHEWWNRDTTKQPFCYPGWAETSRG